MHRKVKKIKGGPYTNPPEEDIDYKDNIRELRMGVMIDRKKEIKTLEKGLDDAISGKGCCYFLAGEAGAGKTRFVREFYKEIKKRKDAGESIKFLSGRCVYQEGADPYLPFVDALRQYFNILKTDNEETGQRKLTETLKRSSPELLGAVPIVGGLLACGASLWKEHKEVKEKIQSEEKIDYKQERYKLFESLYQLINKISKDETLVIFLDDLHWADDSSLAMLQYLLRKTRDSKVLFIGSYRPEDLDDSKGVHRLKETLRRMEREKMYETIPIEGLSKEDTGSLVKSIIKSTKVNEDFLEWIYEKTEGNPVYVESIINNIRESDSINFEKKDWDKKVDMESIPKEIGDIVDRRIDRLKLNMKEILKYASVYGINSFTFDELEISTGMDDKILSKYLDQLMGIGLIVEDPTDPERLKFGQPMVSARVYQQIPLFRRPILHEAAGKAMEKIYAGNLGGVYTELAHHFSRAKVANPEIKEKAIKYSIETGMQTMENYAQKSAVKHFETALKLLETKEEDAETKKEKIDVLINLGNLEDYGGQRDKALEYYDKIIQIPDDDPEIKSKKNKARREKGRIYFEMEMLDEAQKIFKENINTSQETEDKNGIGECYRWLGDISRKKADYDKAMDYHGKALGIFGKLENETETAKTKIEIIKVLNNLGKLDEALEYYNEAMPVLEKSGLIELMVKTNNNISCIYHEKNDYDKAYEFLVKGKELSDKHDYIRGKAYTRINISENLAIRGKFDEAEEELKLGLEFAKQIQEKSIITLGIRNYGIIYTGRGEFEKAENYFNESLEEAEDEYFKGDIHWYKASMYKKGNLYEKAKTELETAIKIFKEIGAEDRVLKCKDLYNSL